ncbi:MAG TPA: hypothetical protein P5232_03715 [Candidatus Moranbacteria bacterium]|nr:hypothetical protein [Candidatus Moranbacteria bacterium]
MEEKITFARFLRAIEASFGAGLASAGLLAMLFDFAVSEKIGDFFYCNIIFELKKWNAPAVIPLAICIWLAPAILGTVFAYFGLKGFLKK